ncbi:MAG: methylated-DNA--[protein]-cysteine S-methyltransferase [Burkholderiaceae bacterium]
MKTFVATHQLLLPTPLGEMRLAVSEHGLAGAWFTTNQRHVPDAAGHLPQAPEHPLLNRAAEQLHAYFAGQRSRFELPLDLSSGTAFQQAVWAALQAIEFGATCSYRAVAIAIGRPSAVRAVGLAIGRNPVSLIVPCHRVVGADGQLTGYGGGLDRKIALLELERRDADTSTATPVAA